MTQALRMANRSIKHLAEDDPDHKDLKVPTPDHVDEWVDAAFNKHDLDQ